MKPGATNLAAHMVLKFSGHSELRSKLWSNSGGMPAMHHANAPSVSLLFRARK